MGLITSLLCESVFYENLPSSGDEGSVMPVSSPNSLR